MQMNANADTTTSKEQYKSLPELTDIRSWLDLREDTVTL